MADSESSTTKGDTILSDDSSPFDDLPLNTVDYTPPPPFQKEPTWIQKLTLVFDNLVRKLMEWFK